MSNRTYLEIDSTYRNREEYKNPSNFTVLIAQSGTRDAEHAYDPVSLAAPQKVWSPSDINPEDGTVVGNTNNKGEFIIKFNQSGPNQTADYYVGYPIKVTNYLSSTGAPSNIVINGPSGTLLTSGTSGNIVTSDTSGTFIGSQPSYSGPTGYTTNGSTGTFETTGSTGSISFDQITGHVTPTEFNPTTLTHIASWNLLSYDDTNIFFTVSVNPELSAIPDNNANVVFNQPTELQIGAIFVPGGFLANNYYVGCILYNESLREYRPIISYDGTTRMIGLDLSTESGGVVSTWGLSDVFSIRKDKPIYTGTFPDPVVGYNQTTSFLLEPNTNVSVGDFIRITGAGDDNKICRVVSYTGDGANEVPANPKCNPPKPLIPAILANIATTNCIMNPPIVLNGDHVTYEILQFTRDNAVPFTYIGSLVSHQQMVCYEIELVNLVLPNKILKSGGRVAFYPYVYVELQNLSSSSSGTRNVIYSNNPNSVRMLFRAAIDDIPNPITTPFVKIDGCGMVQTVKFKPNDNFKFGVYLPNGEPLETIYKDEFSPSPPNPLLQVSALFSIKRCS
jgi:hypothetical protein